MSLYRKKPVVIEAFKLGVDHIPDWFMDAVTANEVILHGTSSGFDHVADTNADIHTLEGWHHANYGDYIIRGVKGELYPCKPDIFEMTYDVELPNPTLEEMELSVRCYNVLKRAGIKTAQDVAKLDYNQLIRIRNLGKHSYDEIVGKLEALGYNTEKMKQEV